MEILQDYFFQIVLLAQKDLNASTEAETYYKHSANDRDH